MYNFFRTPLRPSEEYNAADFATDAHKAAKDIDSRGALPIVVGGTGFYVQWLVFGRPGAPAGAYVKPVCRIW